MNIPTASKDYLNSIQIPTTQDFNNYFQILLLELQNQSSNNRWNAINPNHFTCYDSSRGFYYEAGIKIVLVSFDGAELELGVKCKRLGGRLMFYLFYPIDIFESITASGFQSIRESYISGGYNNVYDYIVDFLDNVAEQISRLVNQGIYSLKTFHKPNYRLEDIRHIDELHSDNTIVPF